MAEIRSKLQKFGENLVYVCSAILKSLVLFFVPKTWRFKDVSGEIVLITGAGSGIGRLLAIGFSKLGAEIVACDINKINNEETCRIIETSGGVAHGYILDVSDRKCVYATAKKVNLEVGKVTVLVNNAGILFGADFLDLPDEKIMKTFAVNAMGPMWMCKAFLPDMLEADKGHIVNIASMGGNFGSPKLSDYCASKHALIGFDESLKMELHVSGHQGVRTTVVCPNFFSSGLYTGLANNSFQPEMSANYVATEILKGVLTNEEKVYIPAINRILVPVKHLFPVEAVIRFLEVVGIITGLKDFKGARNIDSTMFSQEVLGS